MTHHGTQNIRSLDKVLSRSTSPRVQSMGMMDYLVDVMSLQEAAIFDREEVYVQTSTFLFPPSGRSILSGIVNSPDFQKVSLFSDFPITDQ
jgi:hypothetical protein